MALVRGGYAEFVPARAHMACRVPEGMSFQDAASIPCVFLTAWYALTKYGQMRRGETVLIHAAGSGVGIAGIQIARALGARVLTSAGSDAKVAKGVELGAEAGVNYTNQDVAKELQRLTNGRGVDVVVDSVGGAVFDATLRALAPGGRVTTVGTPAGARSEVDQQALAAKGQREEIREERREQAANALESTQKPPGKEIGADYLLRGSISTIQDEADGTKAIFYQVDLEMVDISNNVKSWYGQKKIKKVVERKRVIF